MSTFATTVYGVDSDNIASTRIIYIQFTKNFTTIVRTYINISLLILIILNLKSIISNQYYFLHSNEI